MVLLLTLLPDLERGLRQNVDLNTAIFTLTGSVLRCTLPADLTLAASFQVARSR